ncbi:MAG: Unknown protein [uncultured Sulfurovum sp.]|uniref:Uncharacterized protein n=1 Tax=uncultured Sulfurovum sp. TaxID=269237 RepID=A0A6S6TNQ4_9BACT|nr:MAG: Unknown protein [uncultured Sulfurovum sp.]
MIDKEQLIKDIETAFADVHLNEGIGINEADKIELRERDAFRQKGRNQDRLWWQSWKEIEDKYPASYSSVMDFMDSEGLRWVMPVYLIYIIKHYKEGSFSVDSTIYTLEAGGLGTDGLDLYTIEQKKAIAKFLQFMVEVGAEWVDVESAQNALDNVWGEWV